MYIFINGTLGTHFDAVTKLPPDKQTPHLETDLYLSHGAMKLLDLAAEAGVDLSPKDAEKMAQRMEEKHLHLVKHPSRQHAEDPKTRIYSNHLGTAPMHQNILGLRKAKSGQEAKSSAGNRHFGKPKKQTP